MRELKYSEVRETWRYFNKLVFNDKMLMPPISIVYRKNNEDLGWCWKQHGRDRVLGIALNCAQLTEEIWKGTLLHEMFHQYESEVLKLEFFREDVHENFDEYQQYVRRIGLCEDILNFE